MATMPLTTKTIQVNVVYLILGAGVLFGIGGAVGGGIAAVAMKVVGRKVDAVTTAKPKYTRIEFNDIVVGKTTEEVLKLVGKPGGTHGTNPEDSTWYYHNICYDPITGRSDQNTIVEFRKNIAVKAY